LGTRCSLKMSKNMNKRATKRKSATENSILKFLTISSVSSDCIVKGIIDDIIKTAVKTAKVDEQKTKYLQHLQQSCQIKQRYTLQRKYSNPHHFQK
jgi:hypothetical protein